MLLTVCRRRAEGLHEGSPWRLGFEDFEIVPLPVGTMLERMPRPKDFSGP